MLSIMISYRRSDSVAITGRIFDRLVQHYGKSCVFRDIEDVPLGVDFRNHIAKVLDESSIVLVVIGQRWIGRRGGQTRLNDPADPVRIEVETALSKGVPVVPILVDRVGMPRAEQLPESLQGLVYRNGLTVDAGSDFEHHVDRLIQEIDRIVKPPEAPKRPRRHRMSLRQLAVVIFVTAAVLLVLVVSWIFFIGDIYNGFAQTLKLAVINTEGGVWARDLSDNTVGPGVKLTGPSLFGGSHDRKLIPLSQVSRYVV